MSKFLQFQKKVDGNDLELLISEEQIASVSYNKVNHVKITTKDGNTLEYTGGDWVPQFYEILKKELNPKKIL